MLVTLKNIDELDSHIIQFILKDYISLMQTPLEGISIRIISMQFPYPITCPQRSNPGQSEDFLIILPYKSHHWSQLIYQLAHEMGHLYMSCYPDTHSLEWISECLCELMSLIFMHRAIDFFEVFSPAFVEPHRKYIHSYLDGSLKVSTANCSDFVKAHFEELTNDPTEDSEVGRPRNLYIASKLFEVVGFNGIGIKAIMRFPELKGIEISKEFFKTWRKLCGTEEEKVFVDSIGETLGF